MVLKDELGPRYTVGEHFVAYSLSSYCQVIAERRRRENGLAKGLIAQLAHLSVSNEDAQGSNHTAPIILIEFIKENGL